MKRIFDLVISIGVLMVFTPIFIIIAVAIYFSDRGPVLFKQRRIGKNRKEFYMYKFRSMVVNAEELGGYSTSKEDPRITLIGRFIRRTSLDELPQLFNVLLGDMSIVGPRPDVPAQYELYTSDEWNDRHRVRPGITGLAQSTLRSEATFEQRKKMDLKYSMSKHSLVSDCGIIAKTFKQVICKGGN
jgi:lipopolysaccharide/colanic/teichoic acid biosynthesis glycosyltransferase